MNVRTQVVLPEINNIRHTFLVVMPSVFGHRSLTEILKLFDLISFSSPQALHHSFHAFNIKEIIEKREQERAAKFFDPANLERMGRRAGKFDLVKTLTDMTQDPSAYTEKQKLKMLQFVSDQYNDHIGAPRTHVKLYNGNPQQGGYFKVGGRSIYINRNNHAFTHDFAALINTVVHENTHNLQAHPNAYSDPVLSRIYRANFQAYLNASTHGYHAYRRQPIELGAFAAGKMAENCVRKLTGVNDNAVRPHAFYDRQGYHFPHAA